MNIADMHCDTIEKLHCGFRKNLLDSEGHLSIKSMIEGNYMMQNFAVFVDKGTCENPLEEALKMMDRYYMELEQVSEYLAPVLSFQDIVDNQANGKMSSLLTIEEGGTLKGSLENLRNFYRLGVRMLALTWNYENELGSPNLMFDSKGNPRFQERNEEGLTEFGILAVEKMDQMGMIPDVSHLSDGGFWDVVHHTKNPFVASHSNAEAICRVCRNLTDVMIRIIAERGGVIGLNFCEDFLTAKKDKTKEVLKKAVIAHIRHIVKIGGIEVCSLGSDFDGIPGNKWLKDASFMPEFVQELDKSGFTQTEIEKICYKNVLRVYQEVL